MSYQKMSPALIVLSLSACSWVDSTGNQAAELPALINPSLAVLSDGDSININENTERTAVFGNSDNLVSNWQWTRLDGQADVKRCNTHANFEQNYAFNSLSNACADNGNCDLHIEESESQGITSFKLTTPQLRAPAALEYLVSAQNEDGAYMERRQLICAIPINDAPDAVDDEFTVMRSTTLKVSGDRSKNLLANDSDDNDIRNKPLTVLTTPASAPQYAAQFELFEDGGFLYVPVQNAPISNGEISDRFTYSVTDGTSTQSATVNIKIIDFNTAPVQTATLPEVTAFIWDQGSDITYADMSIYFSDAESDAIAFSANDETLPTSGNLYFTEYGLLKGNPEDFDSGRYFVQMFASDSIESIDAGFYLNVVRSNGVNKAPYASDISNNAVTGDFTYDITEFFIDADGDNMTFTATNLPDGVEISPEGIISGTANANNSGRVVVRVFANDGHGGVSSDGFRLILR